MGSFTERSRQAIGPRALIFLFALLVAALTTAQIAITPTAIAILKESSLCP